MGLTKIRLVAMCDCGYAFPRLVIPIEWPPGTHILPINPSRCPSCKNLISEIISFNYDGDEFVFESTAPQKERR